MLLSLAPLSPDLHLSSPFSRFFPPFLPCVFPQLQMKKEEKPTAPRIEAKNPPPFKRRYAMLTVFYLNKVNSYYISFSIHRLEHILPILIRFP